MKKISVQTGDFDASEELKKLCENRKDIGATVNFIGLVRDNNLDDDVTGLSLQHYPGMTEKALAEIAIEAEARWDILGYSIIHRVGDLKLGDRIVWVAIASPHRGDAFNACEFIMDYLKTKAPFWKKELLKDGSSRWLDARESDTNASSRW